MRAGRRVVLVVLATLCAVAFAGKKEQCSKPKAFKNSCAKKNRKGLCTAGTCPKKAKKCTKTRNKCKLTCGLCPAQQSQPESSTNTTFQTPVFSACGCDRWANYGSASEYSFVCVKTQQIGDGATEAFEKICYGYSSSGGCPSDMTQCGASGGSLDFSVPPPPPSPPQPSPKPPPGSPSPPPPSPPSPSPPPSP